MKAGNRVMRKLGRFNFFLIILLIILNVAAVGGKRNYHVDEILSYTLANSVTGMFVTPLEGKTYYEVTPYDECMAVHHNLFDYSTVWENQRNDVHPPLYYAILHTICSLFPDTFSRWYAAIINIIFSVLTFKMLQKIVKEFNGDYKYLDYMVEISFVLSAGIIQANTFLRMYTVAMFFVTWLVYLHMKIYNEEGNTYRYIELFLAIMLGALTHYYVVVFAVFQFLCLIWYLVRKKRWNELTKYILSFIFAGFHALITFPYVIQHIFQGNRGKESLQNFTANSGYVNRITEYWKIINQDLFGGILGIIIIGGGVIWLLKRYNGNMKNFLGGGMRYVYFFHVSYISCW